MSRGSVRLSRRHERWIYWSFGALLVSGLAWIGAQLWLGDGGPFGESPSPLARWSMQLHGAAAMIALVVLGSLLPNHVSRAWRSRRSRGMGALVVGSNALLVASGYALYYAGGERLRAIVSPLHWVVGLALPVLLAAHVWRARPVAPRIDRREAPGRQPVPVAPGKTRERVREDPTGVRERPGRTRSLLENGPPI